MGFLEHIFGYSNIDSAMERAASLKNENQVSVKEIKELIKVIDNYIRSRSEWAHGVGVPGGHSKMSIYSNSSIYNAKDKLELVLITITNTKSSESLEEFGNDIAKSFLGDITLIKHNMF